MKNSKAMLTATMDKIRSKYKSKKVDIRKRDGELNLVDSDCDPDKWCIPSHCIIYITIILFSAFLIVQVCQNDSYFQHVKEAKTNLISNYSQRIS